MASEGCLSSVSSPSNEVQLTARAADRNRQSLFADETDRWDTPFEAAVFTDPETADAALNIDEHNEPYRAKYLDFDSETEFVAVVASTLAVLPEGGQTTSCPNVSVKDETIQFELSFDEWPTEPEPPYQNWYVLTRWDRNGNVPPEYASVTVHLPDERIDSETCSD